MTNKIILRCEVICMALIVGGLYIVPVLTIGAIGITEQKAKREKEIQEFCLQKYGNNIDDVKKCKAVMK